MSTPPSERTIYRSASAAAAEPAPRRRRRRTGADSGPAPTADGLDQVRRRRWWPAPLLAFLILAALVAGATVGGLGASGLLAYFGVTVGSHDYSGSWGAAGTNLGSTTLTIVKHGGGYAIDGVRILGVSGGPARVSDDSLVTSGTAKGVTWRLGLSFANRDQLRANVTYSDGRPPLEILLTKQ